MIEDSEMSDAIVEFQQVEGPLPFIPRFSDPVHSQPPCTTMGRTPTGRNGSPSMSYADRAPPPR